jgi:heme/copper-type cytochrome/quinol oxidase subunit 2
MEIKLSKQAILTPLIGLVVGWTLFMFAIYSDLFYLPIYDYDGMYTGEAQVVKISTYLYLIGLVVFGLLALRGQQLALHARALSGPEAPLPRAAHRFTNLTVVISLVGGSIYAIGNFLSAFSLFGNENVNLLVRLFDVYIPIVLATVLVIYILLRAFVFRKQNVKEAKKKGLSESEKSLGLGYAIPILFTAVAIIFGLVVYDITRTDLQVWVWVVIQVIIALGILLGTRFSSKAKSAKAVPPRPKQTLAAGAANLNFVLSIVFGATVSIMSFSFGSSAIDSLRIWPEYKEPMEGEEIVYDPGWEVAKFEWSWFFESMLPALVLLVIAAVGIYLFITERNQSGLTPSTKKASSKAVTKTKAKTNKTAKKISAGSKSTSRATAPRKRK